MSAPELSLVVPTYNERSSIAPLLAELELALGSLSWEVVFVDDSTDGTDAIIAAIGNDDPRVRLLHRLVNRGGLSGAVVDGLSVARGSYVCVMDADLQHPPSRIPDMLRAAQAAGADVVVASRYVSGGSTSGLDGPLRQFYSRGLRDLSRLMFPRRLRNISDPLGGYFLLQRSVIQDTQLRPIGYKILLEILIRCACHTVREVPYRFQPRQHGVSKANLREGLRFLRHLAQLVWDCSPVVAPLRRLVA